MLDEGYIKYKSTWIKTAPIEFEEFESINECRTTLFQYKLIGEYKDLGIGYGNISIRDKENPSQFIISGTQTGKYPILKSADYSRVISYDFNKNELKCEGAIKASSEALTHAIFYELDTNCHAVIHIHDKEMWTKLMHKVPTSNEKVAYGTIEMVREVSNLYKNTILSQKKILVMAGHDEGIITFGKNLKEALNTLLTFFNTLKPNNLEI